MVAATAAAATAAAVERKVAETAAATVAATSDLLPALQRALASMVESNADQFSEMSGLSVLRNRIHDHAQQRVERRARARVVASSAPPKPSRDS